jgi:predicted nuclease of predicted toxin-antitoxin system
VALKYLLDENISPVVAQQIRQKQTDLPVESLHEWQDGNLMGRPDSSVLRAAHEAGMVVVTFDTQILSELYFWFDGARPFGGLLFVDNKTIASNDFGALTTSLIAFWNIHQEEDCANRLAYLNVVRGR